MIGAQGKEKPVFCKLKVERAKARHWRRGSCRWLLLTLAAALAAVFQLCSPAWARESALPRTGTCLPSGTPPSQKVWAPKIAVKTKPTNGAAAPDLVIEADFGDYESILSPEQLAPSTCQLDLQTFKLSLPEGFMADVNSTDYCLGSEVDCGPGRGERGEVSAVGTVEADAWVCVNISSDCSFMPLTGYVYNAAPGSDPVPFSGGEPERRRFPWYLPMSSAWADPELGEQGHLKLDFVVFKAGVHVYVRPEDKGLDTYVTVPRQLWQGKSGELLMFSEELHISRMKLTLWGSSRDTRETSMAPFKGYRPYRQGHPAFLINPSFCKPQDVKVSLTSYGRDGWPSGDDETVVRRVPLRVTGCSRVPYHPKLDMALDTHTPRAAPALTTTITQLPGEATNDRVEVRFPKAFKPNFQNQVKACSDAQMARDACPKESEIGTAQAESPLLPLEPSPYVPMSLGPLEGKVYLGRAGPDDIKLHMALKGFIPIDIEGSVTMRADGTAVATFKDLPAVPISRFTLSLVGGKDRGLLLLPARCGTYEVKATFTSHQGKQARRSVPISTDCTPPTFEVEVDPARSRRYPTVTLDVTGSGIKSTRFKLSRNLKIKGARRLTYGKRYGSVTFTTDEGIIDAKLVLLRGSRRALALSATDGGAEVASAQLRLGTPLRRRAKRRCSQRSKRARRRCRQARRRAGRRRSKAAANKSSGKRHSGRRRRGGKRRKRRRARRTQPATLTFYTLPPGTRGITVEIEGETEGLIRNPASCRRALGFEAKITDPSGSVYTPYRTVDLKCAKAKKKKGKRRRRGRSKARG